MEKDNVKNQDTIPLRWKHEMGEGTIHVQMDLDKSRTGAESYEVFETKIGRCIIAFVPKDSINEK